MADWTKGMDLTVHSPVAAPAPVGDDAAKLIRASVAPNTVRAYRSALRKLDAWLAGRPLSDAALADYLGALDAQGLAAASAATAVAAARFRARHSGDANPAGPLVERALKGFRVVARGRGRGQAPSLTPDAIYEIMGVAARPRGRESARAAARRGAVDAVIVGVLFQACLRRSELAELRWRDVEDADGGLLIRVRSSKTNREGDAADVRFVKGVVAAAVRKLRPVAPNPDAKVIGLSGQSIGLRFKAACAAAGHAATAHSARVSLASAITRCGATLTETMLAGGWKSAAMVRHYSAGASAERGAVAKYL